MVKPKNNDVVAWHDISIIYATLHDYDLGFLAQVRISTECHEDCIITLIKVLIKAQSHHFNII